MSIINNGLLLASQAAAGGYSISRSLRFSAPDSAFLSRTPASAGNRKTWTWAGWVKRGKLGISATLFASRPTSSPLAIFYFSDQDYLRFDTNSNSFGSFQTNAVFRDCSAWYHIVFAADSTQSTDTNRLKLYVNGVQQTFASATYPSQNTDGQINTATLHGIGAINPSTYTDYFDGYLADVHFIDGQALDPTSFGEFDTNGVWQPIEYTGSYGTNGFHLDFADNSSAAALGYDAAGSNDWTVNNLSVTAGAGNDSLRDSPTNGDTANDTGLGGQVPGNYCTLNPLDNPGNTLSNGNLDLVGLDNSFHGVRSTLGVTSGKWYFECTIVSFGYQTRTGPGLYRPTDNLTGDYGNGTVVVYDYLGTLYVRDESGAGSTWYSTSGSISANDVFGFAFDLDAQKVWVHQNGTWLNSGNPGAGTGAVVTSLPVGTYFPGGWAYNTSDNLIFNFGQRAFAYNSNRSGFKALCTTNLPTPTIADGSTAMDVKLYTGNGSTQTISGLNLSPDLVWIKNRTGYDHVLFDPLRGPGGGYYFPLTSNATNQENIYGNGAYGAITSFNSDGFSLGSSNSDYRHTNQSPNAYVAWTWDAGSSTVTNTSGSISSQVRANVSAGFSIVTASPNQTSNTMGHGLNATPHLIIAKSRTVAYAWNVYHVSLGSGSFLRLSTTDASQASSGYWGTINSSVIGVATGNNGNNTGDMVYYCFAPVSNFSSFGSYTGNGSSDGPFVYTGHRSRWIMIKRTDSAGNWGIYDTARDPENVEELTLLADTSGSESTDANKIDIISNGFKARASNANINASGGTYVFASFASHPFQTARAR